MRILYVTPGIFDKGGIARYNRYQIRAIQEAFGEDSLRIISLSGRQIDDFEDPISVTFAGASPVSTGSRVLFGLEILQVAMSFRPDLIISAHINLAPLVLMVAKAVKARFILNVYGRELWTSNGLSYARKCGLNYADTIISDCHNTASYIMDQHIAHRSIRVIWDCVDTQRFSPGMVPWGPVSKYGISNNGKYRILFLGRVNQETRYKGFERLVKLISMLPSDKFEGVIAGTGDDLNSVRKLAIDLGVNENIIITGSVNEVDLANIYRTASAFYLVSEVGLGMGEGIPLTPMEAMACAVPVIVGNQDGSRELLDGCGGWCGNPSDLDGQIKYLAKLAGNPELQRTECDNARQRSCSTFCYERFYSEFVDIIQKITRRSN